MQIEEAIEICKAIIKNMQEECEFDLNILKLNWNNRIAIDTVINELEKKDKVIDEIQKEVRSHIRFENRLKRDNIEPDLYNQGRFYVANNIKDILQESK